MAIIFTLIIFPLHCYCTRVIPSSVGIIEVSLNLPPHYYLQRKARKITGLKQVGLWKPSYKSCQVDLPNKQHWMKYHINYLCHGLWKFRCQKLNFLYLSALYISMVSMWCKECNEPKPKHFAKQNLFFQRESISCALLEEEQVLMLELVLAFCFLLYKNPVMLKSSEPMNWWWKFWDMIHRFASQFGIGHQFSLSKNRLIH